MSDIVERLRKRQMMQDVRGTGDRFSKQVAVPDPLCQLAADEIERLRARLAEPERTVTLPAVGDYVLATKYDDGDPGDPWALGFYAGELDMGNDRSAIKVAQRYLVNNAAGQSIRHNGYRRVARIRKDVGAWLLNTAARQLEQCPPGTVNLWTMLTPAASDLSSEIAALRAATSDDTEARVQRVMEVRR